MNDDVTVKVGRISDASDDSDIEMVRQVETIGGKAKPVFILLPPGFCTNIPLDSTVLMLSSDGQSEFGIPAKPEARFGNLKQMEVKVGNVDTRANVFFCDDGSIYINPNGTEKAEDWMVRYSKLEESFNELQEKFNNHTHAGSTAPSGACNILPPQSSVPPEPSTADISESKSEKVRIP